MDHHDGSPRWITARPCAENLWEKNLLFSERRVAGAFAGAHLRLGVRSEVPKLDSCSALAVAKARWRPLQLSGRKETTNAGMWPLLWHYFTGDRDSSHSTPTIGRTLRTQCAVPWAFARRREVVEDVEVLVHYCLVLRVASVSRGRCAAHVARERRLSSETALKQRIGSLKAGATDEQKHSFQYLW